MIDPCYPHLLEALNRSTQETLWIVDENLPAQLIGSVRPRPSLHCVTNRFDLHEALEAAGLQSELNDFEPQIRHVKQVIYRVSKERALVHHCINVAANSLATGGELTMFGAKNEGIKTNFRNAAEALGEKSYSKKHGLCYEGIFIKALADTMTLPSDDYPKLREVEAAGLRFISKPGVFGWNKIDRGSALLVTALEEHRSAFGLKSDGSLLDLGCGWGYLMLATQALPFTSRFATDNNITAVSAARENFRRAGVNVTTTVDDCGSQLIGPYDLILCNPPFHQGFSVSEALSIKFVTQAARLLSAEGRALFVVNQFVALEKLADDYFKEVTLLLHQDGFKVFALRK